MRSASSRPKIVGPQPPIAAVSRSVLERSAPEPESRAHWIALCGDLIGLDEIADHDFARLFREQRFEQPDRVGGRGARGHVCSNPTASPAAMRRNDRMLALRSLTPLAV